MAGLLDSLPSDGLLGYLRSLDQATQPFMGDYWNQASPNRPSGGENLLDVIKKADRLTADFAGNPFGGARPQPGLNAPQSGDLGMMYGQPQASPQPSPQQPPQQALPPSIASSPMSPQGAEQAFNLPTGSYQFGGQMVPTFGQPQQAAPVEASAQRRSGQQTAIPAAAAAPSAPPVNSNPMMDFLGAIRPGFVDRYEARKTQQQTAQNLATFLQGQGMAPQQAAAMGAAMASNPELAKEFLKPPTTMEAGLVSPVYGGRGGQGDKMARYQQFLQGKNAAEKAGTIQGESQAQAQIDLPGAVATAKEQLRLLDDLANHPGRKQVGWHDFLGKAPLVPSTKGYDAANLLEQVKSGAFMTAFQNLKGGGQITEKEGQAATAAIARMDRATSQTEFDKALEEYKGIIRLGVDRASQKAGQAAPFGFQGNQGWGQLPGGARFKKVSD